MAEKESSRRRTAIDGKTWTRYSISVWNDIQKSRQEKAYEHPAMFPSELAERLIRVFSQKGDLVIDPFVGTGSTLAAAYRRGRRSLGLDISDEFIALARERLAQGDLFADNERQHIPKILKLDARELSRVVEPDSASLCVTSPPYWDILNQKRTADKKELRHYGNLESDLGTIDDYRRFIAELGGVFSQVYECLKPLGYCCIVVMDIRKKEKFYPLHIDLVQELTSYFTLDDIVIWDRRQEYNNLRPLGYPYVFRVNKIHEYILIFQKR